MKMTLHRLTASCALSCLALPTVTLANDFPTVDRVLYVQDCMRTHPGGYYEMVNKCSCAVDRLAEEVKFDDYVTMSTVVNAMTIGGERGSELRDNETLKPQVARFRELQSRVQKACFINPAPK